MYFRGYFAHKKDMASHESAISVSDSDDDDANLPSRDECEQRCKTFSDVTGADSAMAMFFLQERDWNLEVFICSIWQYVPRLLLYVHSKWSY